MKTIIKLLRLKAKIRSKADLARTEEFIKLIGSNPDIEIKEITESELCEGCCNKRRL